MPEDSRRGTLSKVKREIVKLNKSPDHNYMQYFRRTQANEKPNLRPEKTCWRAIKVARKTEILSIKANQGIIIYLPYENRR